LGRGDENLAFMGVNWWFCVAKCSLEFIGVRENVVKRLGIRLNSQNQIKISNLALNTGKGPKFIPSKICKLTSKHVIKPFSGTRSGPNL
jgi:hypothetical protein